MPVVVGDIWNENFWKPTNDPPTVEVLLMAAAGGCCLAAAKDHMCSGAVRVARFRSKEHNMCDSWAPYCEAAIKTLHTPRINSVEFWDEQEEGASANQGD